MNLSDAILQGSALRPESHQERFCNVENRGLCSDVWGAACESVHPQVAKLNWNLNDKQALNSALRYLNEIQHKYFETYFQMPAQCPMATRSMLRGRGRIVNHKGEYVLEDGSKTQTIAGVTDECAKVTTLAGFVDHAFYKHGNSREEIAELVREYEESRDRRVLLATEHYQNEKIRRKIAFRNTLAARQRERDRLTKRRTFAVH